MDAPLWMPLVYGGYKINMKYMKSQKHIIFHQALIAWLVEQLNSNQKAVGSSFTSINETISQISGNLFNTMAQGAEGESNKIV